MRDGVLLLGGASLVDFRVRVAQSQLRGDLSPSYWSQAGLLRPGAATFVTAPLQPPDLSAVPRTNGVQELTVASIDDPDLWPNVAVVNFAQDGAPVLTQADLLRTRRTILDLPELLVTWIGYGWAAGTLDNPLLSGRGVPSAAFVETAHALAGIELTPGLSSASSCPEAIWQAAKWWREYYEGTVKLGARGAAAPMVPSGRYAVRQRSAAMLIPSDAPPISMTWSVTPVLAPDSATEPAPGPAPRPAGDAAAAPPKPPSARRRRSMGKGPE